ncbi:MAG: tripartite tricarboxylate transporter substrate binding protein [Pseudomonadota bacterium]
MRRTLLKAAAAATVLAALAPATWSQDRYPSRPIRFVVPAAAGGPSDVVARVVADKLGQALGQPVVVENKPGNAQIMGTAFVAQANPDGYTLLFTTSTPIVMVPATIKKPPYDVLRDLTTVSHLGITPLVVYSNAALPINNIKQLADYAKSKPDAANYGSYGNGSSAHVLGEMLNKQLGTKIVHVPYKGVAPELQALAGGELTYGVADIGTAKALVAAGKIRPIAVTGTKRAPALPDVATFAEQGITGMEPFSPWWGLFAPAKTPSAIIDQVAAEVAKIVKSPEVRERFLGFGIDPTGTTAAQGHEMTRADMAKWQSIIKDVSYINFE